MSLNLIRDMFFLNEKKFLSKFLMSALTGKADIMLTSILLLP